MKDDNIKMINDKLSRLQSRVSNLSDQLTVVTSELKTTQNRVLEDMRHLAEQLSKK
jgi:uncharacterized coiled-coil protein SlyX